MIFAIAFLVATGWGAVPYNPYVLGGLATIDGLIIVLLIQHLIGPE